MTRATQPELALRITVVDPVPGVWRARARWWPDLCDRPPANGRLDAPDQGSGLTGALGAVEMFVGRGSRDIVVRIRGVVS